MIVERAVPMVLADGCRLLADIYRPDMPGRVPALLERTPYGRHRCDQAEVPFGGTVPRTREQLGQGVVDHGYALVVQECRGTGGSEGVFEKYVHEGSDGVQAIGWVASHPWCDGRVATMGFSYAGMTQLSAATLGAPALAAMFLDSGGFFDAHASGIRRGGAFEIKQATWAVTHAERTARAAGDAALAASLSAVDLHRWLRCTPWNVGASPIAALPSQEKQLVDYWRTEAMGPFWRQAALYARGGIAQIAQVPALLFTSWFDTSLPSHIALWQALRATGSPAALRSPLVVGPWTHGQRHQPWAGDLDFGELASAGAAFGAAPSPAQGGDMLQARLAWFDEVLRHKPDAARAPVRLFMMGGGPGDLDAAGRRRHGGRWIDTRQWPPEAAQPAAWYLQPGGGLGRQAPACAAACAFVADPAWPVATRGGAINSGEPVMQGGAFAHVGAAEAPHVLRFETTPLERPVLVAGPVVGRLWISTDGPDADVTIKLLDVYPDGMAYGLTDGILRLSHRDPAHAPRATVPGEVMAVEVEAYPSANTFAAGHRLRVEIAGSNFPRFDLNPNCHPAQRHMSNARIATTTLHLGGTCASCLQLHLLPAP